MKKLYEFVVKKTYETKGYLWAENEDEIHDMIADLDNSGRLDDGDFVDLEESYSEESDPDSVSKYDIYNEE